MTDSTTISISELKRTLPSAHAVPDTLSFPGVLPPLSIYVHIPWCLRKCPYCDFNSHAQSGELPEGAFLEALSAQIEQVLPMVWGRKIHSVFIGGGTPSLFSAQGIEELLRILRHLFVLPPGIEITMEANPGTFEAQKFAAYADGGINRLSLGIQSFDDRALQKLGRIHDAEQARRAAEEARKYFSNLNLDLMYALPGQSLNGLIQDLDAAISMDPQHVSIYNLTLEPNTVFAKYPPENLPNDHQAADMLDAIIERCMGVGLARYEVSAFSKDGFPCRHNLNYWQFGDYLGLGPGAHGKISFPDHVLRTACLRSPSSWMAAAVKRDGSHYAACRKVPPGDLPFEFMLNALRLRDGVSVKLFPERTGLPTSLVAARVNEAVEKGLMDPDPRRYRASDHGWQFLNDLQMLFL